MSSSIDITDFLTIKAVTSRLIAKKRRLDFSLPEVISHFSQYQIDKKTVLYILKVMNDCGFTLKSDKNRIVFHPKVFLT
jgi:hypothetical protein